MTPVYISYALPRQDPVPCFTAGSSGIRQYEPAFMRMLARQTKVEPERLNLPLDILRKRN